MRKQYKLIILTFALNMCFVFSGCSAIFQITPPSVTANLVQEGRTSDNKIPTPSAALISPGPKLSATPTMDISTTLKPEEPVFLIEEIPEEIRTLMKGKTIYDDSPIGYDDLRYLTVTFWGYDSEKHLGNIIVNKTIADDTIEIFRILLEHEFPIEKMHLPDYYDGKDELSMRDNNTSGFNDRPLEGTDTLSYHQLGLAIDINPLYNPCINYYTNKLEPTTAEKYLDRSLFEKGMVVADDICVTTFKQYGFTWGGDWNSMKDYQHFQIALD